MKDPIVSEIREIRHEIDRECKGDAEAFYKWIVAAQKKLGSRLVRRQPKPLSVKTPK